MSTASPRAGVAVVSSLHDPPHWTGEALPVGTMPAGRPADAVTLLALSAQPEQARPWAPPSAHVVRRNSRPDGKLSA